MENPINVIEKIKTKMSEVIIENDLKYLDFDIDDLFSVYSADFCNILLDYYPGATIMMHKNFKSCAVLIQGVVYTAKGISDPRYYFAAGSEEINFIQKSFRQLSDDIILLLKDKIKADNNNYNSMYILRKNKDNLV